MTKTKKTISIIISAMLIIGFFLIFSYLSVQPGVLLSCEEGTFVSFVNIGTPMKMVYSPGYCSGQVIIKTTNGEVVCENTDYLYNSEGDSDVRIRCPELRHYKNSELIIDYFTYSVEFGNETGTEQVQYP